MRWGVGSASVLKRAEAGRCDDGQPPPATLAQVPPLGRCRLFRVVQASFKVGLDVQATRRNDAGSRVDDNVVTFAIHRIH